MQGEYCTYVLQEYKEKEESERRRKQVAFTLPASISDCGHGIPIINIHITHDGTVVTAREDGFVCYLAQQLNEIKEACYEGKTRKTPLSWTPQVRASCDQTVFTIYKGVKTFDLCQKHSLLVTGGMDKLIRLWNPRFSGPRLHRHSTVSHDQPVLCCSYSQEFRQVVSCCEGAVNGHKGDILCVAQCPPSFLATSSCDGEIIVWNMASQRVHCWFSSPVETEHRDPEAELDESVPCILFLQNSTLQRFPATALLSSGIRGYINLWDVLGGGKLVGKFKASKFQQKIVKLARADNGMLLYTADRIGYIYIYDLEKFDPEKKKPGAENFWRAHTSAITGLETVDSDQAVLTSSTDRTVRLWSAKGEFIGTFGQPEIWSVHIPSSWKHPGVPYEVLIDPLSMPDRGILKGESHLSEAVNPDKTEADRGELKSPDETVRNMSM
ncbi:unnamed protein product [Menidia menidia]|uniref:(Atlantic silverside) hypothetical protein n=1 Tax=Menidia menidia TaxID=238744 RepID=A0A8S4BKF8_9TELE|nr:unnamed protein product [Menidia menidia]